MLKTPLFALLFIAAGYAASPCLTLYRLHDAIRSGDTATLGRLVDWSSVREGLDEDIADDAANVRSAQAVSAGTQLAPFGLGFMRGVATQAVDTEVTAPNLLRMMHAGKNGGLWLRYGYFDSPTEFVVHLAGPAQEKVELRLNFTGSGWRLTRIWVPMNVLRDATRPAAVEAALD